MARYVKLDKIEPLPTDGVLDDITKSLQDWVWEAYKKGIKEQIVANTILIDKHFAKTNRIIVGNFDIPPMICGLEIKVTEELPDGYSFALVEAPKTEGESIIEKAKTEVAREIFEEIENAHEECIHIDASTNIGYLLQTKFEHKLDEPKKKYTGG